MIRHKCLALAFLSAISFLGCTSYYKNNKAETNAKSNRTPSYAPGIYTCENEVVFAYDYSVGFDFAEGIGWLSVKGKPPVKLFCTARFSENYQNDSHQCSATGPNQGADIAVSSPAIVGMETELFPRSERMRKLIGSDKLLKCDLTAR